MERKNIFDLHDDFFKMKNIERIQEGSKEMLMFHDQEGNSKENEIHDPKNVLNRTCNTCSLQFENEEEQFQHFKSDWHSFNLKLKVAGVVPVSFQDYQMIKSNGEDDDSSSDEEWKLEEEEEEENQRVIGSSKLIFVQTNGERFSIWKNLVKQSSTQEENILKSFSQLNKNKIWCIFLCHGGRFAGGIFNGKKCIKHKTFHRYTVRKKQGGTQSSRDGKNGTSAPKSAGASMRRYNETRMREDVRDIVTTWKSDIESSHLIFWYAPSQNRFYFLFENSPIEKNDPRIRSIPFATKKPTLLELQIIHQTLSTIEFLGPEETTERPKKPTPEKRLIIPQTKPIIKKEEPITTAITPDLLLEAVIEGDLQEIKKLYQERYERPSPQTNSKQITNLLYQAVKLDHPDEIIHFLIEKETINFQIPEWKCRTVLHRATIDQNERLILLLLEKGANPTLKDETSSTPYDLAKEKKIKVLFRRFAGLNPEKWNYKEANIPILTPEMEKQKQKINKEKKKKQTKLKKEKQKQKNKEENQVKLENEIVSKAQDEKLNKEVQMSEREKRALAAEKRIAAAQGNVKLCEFCKKPLPLVPFSRLDFQYCTTKCLIAHKKELELAKKPS